MAIVSIYPFRRNPRTCRCVQKVRRNQTKLTDWVPSNDLQLYYRAWKRYRRAPFGSVAGFKAKAVLKSVRSAELLGFV